ncbi:recombinase family protein [Streptomyces sp. NPDC004311]|uniref:recombinase family protein n=1 Tax=Streptomyces sp. NPDC004311 TaxID=3364698 RepID=UPI00368560CE
MTTATERLRLVAVLRVSTDGQLDGYGLPAQQKDVKKWAKLAGHRLTAILGADKEGATAVSGTQDERADLTQALLMLEDGQVDGILFPNMDRLARELTVQEAILSVIWSLGGRAFTADSGEVLQDDPDDPMRTAMRQMAGVFSQLERGMITKRLRNGRKTKGEKGGYAYGSPRYGWISEKKTLVEDAGEQEGRGRAKEMRAEGLSYAAIGKKLEEEGIKTKRGGKWHAATVQRLLDDDARERNVSTAARIRQQKKDSAKRAKAQRVLGKVG